MSRTTATVPTTPRSRKAKSRRTDFVEVRYTCPGKPDIVDQWPRELYEEAEQQAKADGISFEEYVNQAVRRQFMASEIGGLTPLTVQFSPALQSQLLADCEVLGITPSELLECAAAVPSFNNLLDFAVDYLSFDTRKEAIACGQRIVSQAQDEYAIIEAIKREDGRWELHPFTKRVPIWHELFRTCEEVGLSYTKVRDKVDGLIDLMPSRRDEVISETIQELKRTYARKGGRRK